MSVNLKPGDRVIVSDSTEFPCPFCQRRVTYGKMISENGFAAISHVMPMCQKFMDNDGSEFVRLCLSALEKRVN